MNGKKWLILEFCLLIGGGISLYITLSGVITYYILFDVYPFSWAFTFWRFVKFALRVVEEVDPTMPFVVDQELDIFVNDTTTGELLQHSTYGDSSTNYRINEFSEQYITNFKTHKTPTTYLVIIYRRDFYIGDFTFTTVK